VAAERLSIGHPGRAGDHELAERPHSVRSSCHVGLAAGLVAGLYLAIPPVNPGFFASFNVPYPTWYSVTVYLAGLLVCRGGLGAPSAGRALVAGVLAGVGFLFKPNIGAFQLACTMLLVLSSLSPYGTVQAPQEAPRDPLVVGGVGGGPAQCSACSARRGGELTTFPLPAMIFAVLCFRRARCRRGGTAGQWSRRRQP
jgi:hypothetical protein